MKHISKVLALILAIAMLASLMVGCGEKTGGADDPTEVSDNGSSAAAIAGSEQTWGELTVFVPDSMNMQGGNGTFDPDDQQTLWLYDNDKATNYIEVSTKYDEEGAKKNIETSKSVNETYSPEDISFTAGGDWSGITYDAHGVPCTSVCAVIGEKVYFVMAAGHEYDSDVMTAVLESLK